MQRWVDALLAVLLAPVCGACRQPLLHPTSGCICQPCWDAIVPTPPPFCDACGERLLKASTGHVAARRALCALCLRHDAVVDGARAIGAHSGALRNIVHALKYDGRRSVAAPLARLMRAAGADVLTASAVAVPVPLHPARRRERGFNQAEDLARHVGLPVALALKRIRQTPTQTALPAAERIANVAGAFRATRCTSALLGVRVVLVDDVRTTGATLDACARALKEAGVREVFALTAARVETPGS